MDLVSATYNKLEVLAVTADRVLSAAVERCESWLAGRRVSAAPMRHEGLARSNGTSVGSDNGRSGQPLSA
jgi:hypothetical protein